jgi:hypothetical protein
MQTDPFQNSPEGHWQLLLWGFQTCPPVQIETHEFPLQDCPGGHEMQAPLNRKVPWGQELWQAPLKKMGKPWQLAQGGALMKK